ncbi:hypothetical protein M5C99_02000 [Acidovorax sp. NCPPB 2350]|nr:hypothetical protein M5C99_02000 [Acidovorax sp. NCPPB 2350]
MPTHHAVIALLATVLASGAHADNRTDTAPPDGWASQGGGTTGGAAATAQYISKVNSAYKAQILSENNVFEIAGARVCADVVKNPGSSSRTGAIRDTGSLRNGAGLNLSPGCTFATTNWAVPYTGYPLDPAASVKAQVTANAGPGKLTVH